MTNFAKIDKIRHYCFFVLVPSTDLATVPSYQKNDVNQYRTREDGSQNDEYVSERAV